MLPFSSLKLWQIVTFLSKKNHFHLLIYTPERVKETGNRNPLHFKNMNNDNDYMHADVRARVSVLELY